MDIMQTAQLIGFDTVVKDVPMIIHKHQIQMLLLSLWSGMPRKPGMTREDLIGVNAGIVKVLYQAS